MKEKIQELRWKNNEYHKYLLNCNRRLGEWTYAIHYKYIEELGKKAGFKIVLSVIFVKVGRRELGDIR